MGNIQLYNMTKIYLLAKQIHNVLVIFITIIGIAMATTGMVLKFPAITRLIPFIDYELSRKVHNQLSTIFGIAFVLMAITGIVMYIFLHSKKRHA